MQQFIRNHPADVMGVLNGFDRIRFRGTQRWLANERGMMGFLWKLQVKLKHFKPYALKLTRELREHVCVNGREWLCRELDRQGIGYVRRAN